MARKKQNLAPMWNKLMKNVDIDEPHFFLIMCTCVARNESANQIKKSLNNEGRCFESRFSAGGTENYRGGKNLTHKP